MKQVWGRAAANVWAEPRPKHPYLEILFRPKAILALGVAARIVLFFFLDYWNNDDHLGVIRFIVENSRSPLSTEAEQGFQPPLYYILGALIYKLTGSPKSVQLLSLAFSIGSLAILYLLIYRCRIVADPAAQLFTFMLAAFLPQFLSFGLFVSNDALAIFLGCLTVWLAYQYVSEPGWRRGIYLSASASLGLLTKATFLAFVPMLTLLVAVTHFRRRKCVLRAWLAGGLFAIATLAGGSYKFIENYVAYDHLLVTNMDYSPVWYANQRSHYPGFRSSYLMFDLPKLLREPVISDRDAGAPYPMLLYATFWYQYLPESSLTKRFNLLADLIYVSAIIPTMVFIAGLGVLSRQMYTVFSDWEAAGSVDPSRMIACAAAGIFLANFYLLFAAEAKYHAWSIMQARLLFPSISGGLAAFGCGLECFFKGKWTAPPVKAGVAATLSLLVAYLAIAIAFR